MITLQVLKSKINGVGLFSLTQIPANVVLFKSFIPNNSYHSLVDEIPPNNFLNHSYSNNLSSVIISGMIFKITNKIIMPHEELTSNYNETIYWLSKLGVMLNNLFITTNFDAIKDIPSNNYDKIGTKFIIS